VDSVFKALADEGRRALLDALRDRDGQTLGELCEVLADMTRFGVMKHLKVLEEAHLVVTEKRGREKFHYLNPVPIREIHDRWISRYAEPFVVGLLALRDAAESQSA
jgi:DNA-binding transcriptional ArsR family regulator